MLEYFENLISGLEAKLAESRIDQRARKRFALEVARLGKRLYSKPGKLAWCGVVVPFDLMAAFGITSCFVEFVGAMLASTGGVAPMLGLAEENSFSTDGCSYHRAVIGAAKQGLLPAPDFFIASTAPCAGGLATLEVLARHFKRDLFVLDVPSNNSPEAVAYLAEQFKAMVEFVEDHLGEKLKPEALAQAVEYSNQTQAYLEQVNKLTEHVPTPARKKDMVNIGITSALFFGTPGGVEVAKTYRDEFQEKIKKNIAGHRQEKVRLMWLQSRIQFNNPLEKMLEEEMSAAIVFDEFNDVSWEPLDPNDPYPQMAKRVLSRCITVPVAERVRMLQDYAKRYKIDGALNPCHWGCRQGTGGRGMIQKGLGQVGIPVLNLEVDCIDPRNFAEGQLRTRLQAFVEMLAAQKE
jgi:benzoyl-CoA reductase/2-hydroxyglutaryl-CoA dehydratase subunit BcrC/BadD/HgdB